MSTLRRELNQALEGKVDRDDLDAWIAKILFGKRGK
jgi:hypothetical protein